MCELRDGSPVGFLAFHGGSLERMTDHLAELEPGNVLEGQAPIDAALAELKRMTSVAVTNRTG